MIPHFVDSGWRVAGCCRNREEIENLCQKYSPEHQFSVCDISDDSQVSIFCETIIATFRAPDLVLNNAAIINTNAPFWEISSEEFSHIIDTNITRVS